MVEGRGPWTDAERTMVADRLRLNMTCSAIGRVFGLSKKETVRRIVADDELAALRPRLKGINPEQRRRLPKEKALPEPPRSILAESPMRERPAARVDPMLGYKSDDDGPVDKPLPPMPVVPISGMRLVPLHELERGECRWPVEERADVVGKALFCGKVAIGGSYCAAHTFVSLPPLLQRRMGAVGPRERTS